MTIRVEDWMTANPQAIEPDASAASAIDLMIEGGFRHHPVVEPDGRVVGLLAIDDLRSALDYPVSLTSPLLPGDRALAAEYSVSELMSHAPVTAHPDLPLEDAAARLAARRIGCLVVVDHEARLVGVLSETDALHALVALLARERGVERPASDVLSLERQLRAERWRILARLGRLLEEERDLSAERHDQPMDAAEQGSDLQELAVEGRLADLAAQRLTAIERALSRAARGQLGVCESCGGSIPAGRLRALPDTSICVRCAREAEPSGEEPPGEGQIPGEPPLVTARRVHTPEGEGTLLRIAPFGTCGSCGEVEGRFDEEEDAVVCGASECGMPLTDVTDLAVVALDDRTVPLPPEQLSRVEPNPYD